MKIMTIDEAFNQENYQVVENALFDLNKAGIFDPNFLPLARQFATNIESESIILELTPKFKTTRVFVQ